MHITRNIRWGALIVAAGIALPRIASAVGFGEVERSSALGQPLSVDVAVIEDTDEPELLKVRVADAESYAALGLERDAALDGAAVRIVQRDGHAVLQVSARGRVQEPMLDLVLEATHLGARVRRVNTVLLDPPGALRAAEPVVAALPIAEQGPMPPAMRAAPAPRRVVRKLPRARSETRVASAGSGLSMRLRDPPRSLDTPLVQAAYIAATPQRPALRLSERLMEIPKARPLANAATSAVAVASLPVAAAGAPAVAASHGWMPPLWLLCLALAALLWLRLRQTAEPPPAEPFKRLPAPVAPLEVAVPVVRQRAEDALLRPQEADAAMHQRQPLPAGRTRVRVDTTTQDLRRRVDATLLDPAPRPKPRPADGTGDAMLPEVSQGADLSHEAAALIASALAEAPERNDLRYKLLELHHAQGDVEGFTEQAELFAHQLPSREDAHWLAVQRMGRELAPAHVLFAELPTTAGAAAPSGGGRSHRFYDAVDSRRLKGALDELRDGHQRLRQDPAFIAAFLEIMADELGRPTALQPCHGLSQHHGGAMLHLKREDLRPAHSDGLIHVYGQVLLAKYMGKKSVVAASRQGQHGAALATAAAAMGMRAVVYVPEAVLAAEDNASVKKMRALDATLIAVHEEEEGGGIDGRRLALEHWLAHRGDSSFVSTLRAGPAPMPEIISDFHCVVGQEVRRNWLRRFGRLPEALVCHLGAGYKTFGFIEPFLGSENVVIESVASAMSRDQPPPRDDDSANLYRRELADLYAGNQVGFPTVSRRAAGEAARLCSLHEGFEISADNACVLAQGLKLAKTMTTRQAVVMMFA